KIYAQRRGFDIPRSRRFLVVERLFTLEAGALLGVVLFVAGLAIALTHLIIWGSGGFGSLPGELTMRVAALSSRSVVVGGQRVMAGCFAGVRSVGLRRDAT